MSFLCSKSNCALPTALYHYRVQDNNTLSDVKDAKVCFRIAELDYTAKNKLNNDGNKALGKRINEVYHRSIRKAIRTLYKSPNYNYEDRKRVWSAFTPATTDGMLFVERIFAAKKQCRRHFTCRRRKMCRLRNDHLRLFLFI